MKKKYEMNGKTYETMMYIARELGIKRIYPKHFDKYGITVIDGDVSESDTQVAAIDAKAEKKAAPDTPALVQKSSDTAQDTPETEGKSADEVKTKDKKKAEKDTKKKNEDTVDEKTAMESIQNYAKYLKALSFEKLVELAQKSGVDDYSSVPNEGIRRMRITVALKQAAFPNEKYPSVTYSPFRKYSLSTLVKYAEDKGIPYRVVKSNDEIQRMWLTVALEDALVNPEDLNAYEGGDNSEN